MNEALTYVYAALLDVLGYRQRLDEDRQKGVLAFKDSLTSALLVLSNLNEADFSYQAISDTIIVTCSQRDSFISFLEALRTIQLAFLDEGLFVRGGVSYAQHFKSGPITYSHAVARAYELESRTAIHPRIVVDHNIIEMFRSAGELTALAESGLLVDRNGVSFLNILQPNNWAKVYDAARDLYSQQAALLNRQESEFMKHAWFEEYIFSSPIAYPNKPRYIPRISILSSK